MFIGLFEIEKHRLHLHSVHVYFSHTALSFVPLSSILHLLFPSPCIVFISESARVFPCMSLTFPFPPPQGSLLSQCKDICKWRNITTIADVEMLIPSLLSPRLPPPRVRGTSPLVFGAAGSCFCPLKRPAAACAAESVVSNQSRLLIHTDV